MKKALKVAVIAILAVILLLVVASVLVVRSQAFNRYLLAKIIQSAQESTGARIDVQKLAIHWSPFTADLYGIVVHGREANTAPPLLAADHLGVSLGLRALLKHEVDLYAISLDHPVFYVHADAQGNLNLPQAPPSSSSFSMSLVVRHAALRDGVVIYNDEQIPLAADLENVRAQAEYDSTANSYKGSLVYGQGRIFTKDMKPVEHNLRVEFTANSDGVVLNPLILASGQTRLTAHANVSDFANPKIDGGYDAVLVTREIADIIRNPSLPRGEITLSGTVSYKIAPNQTFLKALRLQGRLDSPGLAVRANQISTNINAVHGTYRLQDGNLSVQRLDANLLDGHLSAKMEVRHLDKTPSTQLNATIRGVSLEKISDALPAETRQNARLLGRANLSAQANWTSNILAMKAHSHLEVSGPRTLPQHPNEIPVNGVVDVDYDGARQSASLGRSKLQIAGTELTLSGTVSRNSNVNVEVNAKDLRELTLLASAFTAPSDAPNAGQAQVYDLRGAAHFTGQVTGSTQDPRIKGQLSASNLEVQGSKWRTVRLNLDAASSGVQFQNGYLENSQQGQISFSGRTGLEHWSFKPDSPLSLRAKVTKLSVGDLERLAKLEYPVSGDLFGEIAIDGSEQQPVGHGSLQVVKALAWNEPIRTLNLDFHGDKDTVQSTAQLQIAAGAADARLTYAPKTQRYEVSLQTKGLKLEQLKSLHERAGGMNGVLTANVTGQGTAKDPQLSANLQIPQLQVSGQNFSGINAQLDLAHQHADVKLESVVEQGSMHVNGGVDLTGQYPVDATVDVRALPIGPLLAKHSTITGAAQDLRGYTEIHAKLKGPLKDPTRLEGRLVIPRLDFAYQALQLANDGPLVVNYRNGVAQVESARIKGTGTDLSIQGVVPVQSTTPMNVQAKGAVDVSLLQLVSPDVHSSGRVEIDLQAGGKISQPQTQGNIRIVNTALSVEGAPVTISAMNGRLSIAGNRLQIDKLDANAGGGTISAHGSAIYGKETQFAIDLQAKNVRIHPTGIRSTLDGNLQLNGTPLKSQLTGQVLVDRLSFQEGFDLGTFMSQLSDDSTVSTPSPLASSMNLSISVQSTQNLDLTSSQVSIAGSANLNVTGTAANPVILGRIALNSGELFFQGKRFEIENGTIAFANPVRTEPVLNLYVKTVVEQYNITINFSGSLDRLKTNYTSDPSLAPVDIINLLAFGQTTAEKASNGSTPASLGAQNALAQGVAGQVASKVQNLTGISQLTIDPTAGNNQNPGAQVAIQERVTGTLLLTFSTDVTSTQKQTVQLQYEPKKQVKISVLRDEYGGYGVDVRYHKVF